MASRSSADVASTVAFGTRPDAKKAIHLDHEFEMPLLCERQDLWPRCCPWRH
jgi:hypothetical protein